MNNYILYRAISPSGKSYVGITNNFTKRKWTHEYQAKRLRNKTIFYCALRKYNYKFEWIIIQDKLTKEQAEELEMLVIETLNLTNRQNGYNISIGGQAGTRMSEEGKKRRLEKMRKYYNNPKYIKNMSEAKSHSLSPEHKKHLSQKTKEWFKNPENKIEHSNKMKKYYKENRQKVIENAIAHNAKPFKCNETNQEFLLLSDAAKVFNTDKRNIHSALTGKSKTCKGCTFSYLNKGDL